MLQVLLLTLLETVRFVLARSRASWLLTCVVRADCLLFCDLFTPLVQLRLDPLQGGATLDSTAVVNSLTSVRDAFSVFFKGVLQVWQKLVGAHVRFVEAGSLASLLALISLVLRRG